MTALLTFALAYAVWFAYCAIDAPTLCARVAHLIANRIRHGGTR